jgi:hypothetical protein
MLADANSVIADRADSADRRGSFLLEAGLLAPAPVN